MKGKTGWYSRIMPLDPTPNTQHLTSEVDSPTSSPLIQVRGVDMGYGDSVLLHNISFDVVRGDIFIIMGGSGSGKSTLLRALIGLKKPMRGSVLHGGVNFWEQELPERENIMKRFGILYQGGALWSSMTLSENLALPLEQYTTLSRAEILEVVRLKLALVGLAGVEELYPSELSGGMRKRAGLARALVLDPDMLFLDEPTSGLDPVNARLFDDLVCELRDSLGSTIVVVTHELASIFAIATNSIYIDAESGMVTAQGDPNRLLEESQDFKVRNFLTRGALEAAEQERKGRQP
jgi:phospholipid/cholesterol/gamma-HCH transport system ATP-binding protein